MSKFYFCLVIFITTISQAFALEAKLQPSMITLQGNYPIHAELIYDIQKDVLVPRKSFTGPIIHLKGTPFNAGNVPRFKFSANNDELNSQLKNIYFAAAPNGELYPANAIQNNISKTLPNIGRAYTKQEMADWYWYPYMMDALRLALVARQRGDHPFGALLLVDNKILVEASNSVNTTHDFTAHAERNLEALISKLPETIRSKSILVTSTEPCAMCAGGAVWTGVAKIVYGLSEQGLRVVTGMKSFPVPSRQLLSHAKKPISVIGPVYEPIAAMVHQGFWR